MVITVEASQRFYGRAYRTVKYRVHEDRFTPERLERLWVMAKAHTIFVWNQRIVPLCAKALEGCRPRMVIECIEEPDAEGYRCTNRVYRMDGTISVSTTVYAPDEGLDKVSTPELADLPRLMKWHHRSMYRQEDLGALLLQACRRQWPEVEGAHRIQLNGRTYVATVEVEYGRPSWALESFAHLPLLEKPRDQ